MKTSKEVYEEIREYIDMQQRLFNQFLEAAKTDPSIVPANPDRRPVYVLEDEQSSWGGILVVGGVPQECTRGKKE